MAAISSTYRRPGGVTLVLQILTGIDLVLDLIVLGIAASTLPTLAKVGERALDPQMAGCFLILMLQIALRLAILVVRAVWTLRLTRNAGLFSRFPVTTFWAWAGFLVPVVSLWLPASHMLALSVAGRRQNRWLNPLCLAWAVARWLTCLSGSAILLGILLAYAAYRVVFDHYDVPAHHAFVGMALMISLSGLVSAALSLVLVPWIARRQPTPDQMHHVEVF